MMTTTMMKSDCWHSGALFAVVKCSGFLSRVQALNIHLGSSFSDELVVGHIDCP
jgi:hypothetical protein